MAPGHHHGLQGLAGDERLEVRRAFYVTCNPISQGDRRRDYFARQRRAFPPECERDPAAPPDPEVAVFNLGNPIRSRRPRARVATAEVQLS